MTFKPIICYYFACLTIKLMGHDIQTLIKGRERESKAQIWMLGVGPGRTQIYH
jgi:hypothetical protein